MIEQQKPAEVVKVKRDGPRGWHWIAAAHFDPTKHELADGPAAPAQQEAAPAAAPAKRPPGRTRSKHLNTEATNGDR